MVNDLLDLTRIEQGRIQLDLKPVAPADLVSDAIGRFQSNANDSGILLQGKVAFGLPPVLTDAERLSHVFDNLMGNALTHSVRGGEIVLAADFVGSNVRFSLTDNGDGIPREHLAKVFDKFFQAPGSRSRSGAGLGLAIAKEIVNAHGGTIAVTSEVGVGTTFSFDLPASFHNSDTKLVPGETS